MFQPRKYEAMAIGSDVNSSESTMLDTIDSAPYECPWIIDTTVKRITIRKKKKRSMYERSSSL